MNSLHRIDSGPYHPPDIYHSYRGLHQQHIALDGIYLYGKGGPIMNHSLLLLSAAHTRAALSLIAQWVCYAVAINIGTSFRCFISQWSTNRSIRDFRCVSSLCVIARYRVDENERHCQHKQLPLRVYSSVNPWASPTIQCVQLLIARNSVEPKSPLYSTTSTSSMLCVVNRLYHCGAYSANPGLIPSIISLPKHYNLYLSVFIQKQ